jgi:hypothetical protein
MTDDTTTAGPAIPLSEFDQEMASTLVTGVDRRPARSSCR